MQWCTPGFRGLWSSNRRPKDTSGLLLREPAGRHAAAGSRAPPDWRQRRVPQVCRRVRRALATPLTATARFVSRPPSTSRKRQRAEPGLLALYELTRTECLGGRFEPASGSAPNGFGALLPAAGAYACSNGVGIRALGRRSSASAVSSADVSELLPQARTALAHERAHGATHLCCVAPRTLPPLPPSWSIQPRCPSLPRGSTCSLARLRPRAVVRWRRPAPSPSSYGCGRQRAWREMTT